MARQFRQGSQEIKITKASLKLSVLMNVHGSGQMGISTKVAHTKRIRRSHLNAAAYTPLLHNIEPDWSDAVSRLLYLLWHVDRTNIILAFLCWFSRFFFFRTGLFSSIKSLLMSHQHHIFARSLCMSYSDLRLISFKCIIYPFWHRQGLTPTAPSTYCTSVTARRPQMADQNEPEDLEDVLDAQDLREPDHHLLTVSQVIPYTFW